MTPAQRSAFGQRLVLFPQGQPDSQEHRDRCAELVFWCGGDVDRFIDSPTETLDAFASYLGRIKGVPGDQVLVALTRTSPLALTVVDTRRRLEAWLPILRAARWIVYLDRSFDPFFEATATRYGHLSGSLAEAPVWVGPGDTPFLVLDSDLRDRRAVDESLDELDGLILGRSGTWVR